MEFHSFGKKNIAFANALVASPLFNYFEFLSEFFVRFIIKDENNFSICPIYLRAKAKLF